MKKLKYTWKNYGLMMAGYDIAELTVELADTDPDIKLIIDTREIKIEDTMYNMLNKNHKLDVEASFKKIGKIALPEQTEYIINGCDGDAWELEIDGKKYKGYLTTPKLLISKKYRLMPTQSSPTI
jgi:hypothetical protein